jgi:vanillate O-demethylase monooxygenase subunit
MRLDVVCAESIEALDAAPGLRAMHIITPESALRCHYFYGGARNVAVEDAEYGRLLKEGAVNAFTHEDKPILEAVQANMGDRTDLLSMRPLTLSADAGGMRVRHLLRRLIMAEAEEPVA